LPSEFVVTSQFQKEKLLYIGKAFFENMNDVSNGAHIRIYETDKGIIVTDQSNVVPKEYYADNERVEQMLAKVELSGVGAVKSFNPIDSKVEKSCALYQPGMYAILCFKPCGRMALQGDDQELHVIKKVSILSSNEYDALKEQLNKQKTDYFDRISEIKAQTKQEMKQIEENERGKINALGPEPSLESLLKASFPANNFD